MMRTSQRGMTLVELLVAMAMGLAVTLVVSTLLVAGENHKRTTTSTNDADQTGAYAFHALDRAIRGAGSAIADVRRDRTSPCWHYGVYVTVVFRQVNGVWRLMLQATSPRCPAIRLRAVVRSAPVICRRSAGASPTPRLRNIP